MNLAAATFPVPLENYHDAQLTGLWDVLANRVHVEPLNLWVTLLFLGAVIHTFFTAKFLKWSHHRAANSFAARTLHFLGEVEAVFGIWVLPLVALLVFNVGWKPALHYLEHGVGYNEPVFVVVVMAIAATKPILNLAERCLRFFARLGGGGPGAWWLAILTIGPVLGSFITEPAAMTIAALLLGRQFYARQPNPRFAYATLGLLFVNISVGGVLTHFAAPPVLMVAGAWHWSTPFMFQHFGWIALTGIVIANLGYYLVFRRQFAQFSAINKPDEPDESIPIGVTAGHLLFMSWSVLNAHHPVLLIGGFLFFLAFLEVTAEFQSELQLRSPMLVGFFLAGLVIHGGLQQWWIAPVLGRLREVPLMLGAIGLTAFNDNAAITYLSTLVPGLTDSLKFAVVAGAITGGGLTVIANAPNPAGQAILSRYFPAGISPVGLFLGALPATIVLAICFLVLGQRALDFRRGVDNNMPMKTHYFRPIAVTLVAAMLTGCSSTKKPDVRYIDPGAAGARGGTGIESQDISAAAQKAAQSIVNLPQIAQAATPPTILITPVANRSASPIDTDLYTVKLRGILMQYNTGKVRFLARDTSWNVNNNEQALRKNGEVQQGAARNAATYDYILTAEVRGISGSTGSGRSEYFLVAFKVVDQNDVLLWEDQYEIKKQGNDHTIYR